VVVSFVLETTMVVVLAVLAVLAVLVVAWYRPISQAYCCAPTLLLPLLPLLLLLPKTLISTSSSTPLPLTVPPKWLAVAITTSTTPPIWPQDTSALVARFKGDASPEQTMVALRQCSAALRRARRGAFLMKQEQNELSESKELRIMLV